MLTDARRGGRCLWRGQEGVTSIEYALLGMLIAVAILAAVSGLGSAVNDMYALIASKIPG